MTRFCGDYLVHALVIVVHRQPLDTWKSKHMPDAVGGRLRKITVVIPLCHSRGGACTARMHEMKRGELKSGRSGKKVTSRKQAVAIGLSEARKEGGKVPQKKK